VLAPFALTTLAKVKLFLGISGSAQDSLLEELINYSSSFIEGVCGGRRFLETEYTELYDAPNGDKLFLNQYPITELISLKYRDGNIASPTYTDFNANDYVKYFAEGYIKFYVNYKLVGGGEQLIKMNYKAGYLIDFANEFEATHTLPNDLTMLSNQLVGLMFNQRTSGGVKSETTEGQSVTYGLSTEQLTPVQVAVINRYQKHRMTL